MSVTARPAHVLCFESYRLQRESVRAQFPADAPPAAPESPFDRHDRTLTERQIVHRRRMLEYQRFVDQGRDSGSSAISTASPWLVAHAKH